MGLYDVEPIHLVPTWSNFKRGIEWVSKRLDRYVVVEKIVEET